MKISLRKALLLFGVFVAVVPILFMAVLILIMQHDTVQGVEREFENTASETAKQVVSDVRVLCEMVDISKQKTAAAAYEVVRTGLAEMGSAAMSDEFFTTEIKDQNDERNVTHATFPKLSFGPVVLTPALDVYGNYNQKNGPVQKLLETAKGVDNVEISVFSRLNPEGDMLRVASTVLRKDATPYIGNYISALDSNAVPNPVISEVLAGGSPRGFSGTEEFSFVTAYEPIYDISRNVIGMLSYGMTSDFSSFICDYLQTQRIASNGYIWVIETGAQGAAKVKVSKSADTSLPFSRTGERSVSQIRFDRFLDRAKALEKGDIGIEKFSVPSADEAAGGEMIVAYTYYEPWGWLIGVNVYQKDFTHLSRAISAQADKLLRNMWAASMLVLLLTAAIAWRVSARMSEPFSVLLRLTNHLKSGNIKLAEESARQIGMLKRSNESNIKAMLRLSLKMIRTLSGLIAKVRASSLMLVKNSADISSGVSGIEEAVAAQTEGILKSSRASRAITLSSNRLTDEAGVSAQRAYAAMELAKGGIKDLANLKENSENLTEAAGAISSKLSIIAQKAQAIGAIVSAISAISEKTSLLSLNAAIEASKSGEFGKGFETVAEQIKGLAAKTAASSIQMKSMVRRMQQSLDSGEKEVGGFSVKVSRAYLIIEDADRSLAKIIEQVGQLGPKFESLSKGVSEQADNAAQISETMSELSVMALNTKDKLAEFKSAADALSSTSEALKTQISNFKI